MSFYVELRIDGLTHHLTMRKDPTDLLLASGFIQDKYWLIRRVENDQDDMAEITECKHFKRKDIRDLL